MKFTDSSFRSFLIAVLVCNFGSFAFALWYISLTLEFDLTALTKILTLVFSLFSDGVDRDFCTLVFISV